MNDEKIDQTATIADSPDLSEPVTLETGENLPPQTEDDVQVVATAAGEADAGDDGGVEPGDTPPADDADDPVDAPESGELAGTVDPATGEEPGVEPLAGPLAGIDEPSQVDSTADDPADTSAPDELVDEIVDELVDELVDESGAEDELLDLSGEESASLNAEATQADESITATSDELRPVIECLLFVAEEPLPFKVICKVLGTVPEEEVQLALDTLIAEYDQRGCGLEIREVAGGWRISTRPQHHDFIRKYLKTRPSARLSLPALETLAVIAYKQPITIPEILEIRGVSSSSAIKTLLEKRLIVTRGRKETVGRPMMYGTSRDFLIQFGLKDLGELPSIEDFEDLAQ